MALVPVCAVLGVALVAGCGRSKSGGAAAAGSGAIVIGTANSLTGTLSSFEVAINHGMDVAAEDINRRGGVRGRPIKEIRAVYDGPMMLSASSEPASLRSSTRLGSSATPPCRRATSRSAARC
jgi:hypothetical protein